MSEEQVPETTEMISPERALLGLFDELPFQEKWRRVFEGLKQPQDTGEYKWAHLQIVRLWAPISGVMVPVLSVVLLLLFGSAANDNREWEVTVVDPEKMEKLEEPEEIEPPEEIITEMTDVEIPKDVKPLDVPGPVENAPFSPQPTPVDSVAITKSPIVMKGVYGSRSPGARGSALGKYAGKHGKSTEEAVLRALRWLKKEQNSDGSWEGYNGDVVAPTGLALLTFLAHGETPASEEFGGTVERAIKWLVGNIQGAQFAGVEGKAYGYPIGAYALAEAFGMTKIPMIKDAAEKAIGVVIAGQHPSGGWDYTCKQSTRDDLSYGSWCIQALKAAKMAGLANAGLDEAMQKAVVFLKAAINPDNSFKYTTEQPNHAPGLTSAAVLALQLMGAGRDAQTQQGLSWLNSATCVWTSPWAPTPLYYWYYTTQAKFHSGGQGWNTWNNQFAPTLVHNQTVLKGAGLDGKDIGYWKNCLESERGNLVCNTTFATLSLEVYYRYLPTFKPPEELLVAPAETKGEVDIQVNM